MEDLNKQLEEARLDLRSYNMLLNDYYVYKKDCEDQVKERLSRIESCDKWIGQYKSNIEIIEAKIEKLIFGVAN